MTPAQIKRKWASIDRREKKLAHELAKLQALCAHPNVSKTHKSNIGNWDRSYLFDFHCPDCRKRWSTDQ